MIVRQLEEIEGSDRTVENKNWKSRRLLLNDDKMGFSMHDTILHAGTETHMWYHSHLEAVYCIEGTGELVEKDSGKVHKIAPGTIYALDQHDKHILKAHSQLRMVCVFNPALLGPENHDEHGGYPLLQDQR